MDPSGWRRPRRSTGHEGAEDREAPGSNNEQELKVKSPPRNLRLRVTEGLGAVAE